MRWMASTRVCGSLHQFVSSSPLHHHCIHAIHCTFFAYVNVEKARSISANDASEGSMAFEDREMSSETLLLAGGHRR